PVTGRGLLQLLPELARTYREQRGAAVQRAALVRQLSLSRGGVSLGVLKPAAVRLQTEAVREALMAAGRSGAALGLMQARAAGLMLATYARTGDSSYLEPARIVLDG